MFNIEPNCGSEALFFPRTFTGESFLGDVNKQDENWEKE